MEYDLGNAIALKKLMEQVFGGKAWTELKHCQHLPTWKKYSKRLVKAIEVSIYSTVKITDDDWIEQVKFEVEHGIKTIENSKELDILFANLSACLATISFLQIGFIPIRGSNENAATKEGENWKLDCFRSVQYVQTDDQKKRVIARKASNEEHT